MKSLLTICLLTIGTFAWSQDIPVTWSIDSIEADGVTSLVISADIDPTWKIYSRQTEEGGPIPMEIYFDTEATLVDEYVEVQAPKTYHSDLFDMKVSTFVDKAVFHQVVGKYTPGTKVSAIVTFMTCNGKQCLPPTDVELEITL